MDLEGKQAGDGPVRTRKFFRAKPPSLLTSEQRLRQSDLLRLTHENLPSPLEAIAFLNSYSDPLEGVPLQMALESQEGFVRVQQVLTGARHAPGSAAAHSNTGGLS